VEPETLRIEVNDRDSVTAMLYSAPKRDRKQITLILGHGAGANQLSGFMRMVAGGLAARGFDAMTFNFLYKEQGRSAPDPKARLESCYRAIIEAARKHRKLKNNRLLIGGKSMGGRIASQVAAENAEGISGLVFLGYPLHPPGQPDKLRMEHLKQINVPMLFCQGSRDTFGNEDEIRALKKKLRLPATLYFIAGGDHSFKAPKSAGKTQDEIHEAVMEQIVEWAASL
jgi:uncharacterized protein